MNSIIKNDEKGRCYICGKEGITERHHIFFGSNRKKSEKYGLTVYLCHNCHNEPPNGVHFNKAVNARLRAEAQQEAVLYFNWTTAEFIKEFGKNYIW